MSGLLDSCRIRAGKAVCFGTLVVCGTGYLALKYITHHQLLAKAAAQKNKEKENIKKLFEELKSLGVEKYEAILKLSPDEIIQAAKEGKLKPVDICRAYLYKACLSSKKWNSVTSFLVDAQDKASDLAALDCPDDKKLYGLPVSLKECMDTKGLETTLGMTDVIGQPANEDCVLAKVLQHCGAIPFVKTNVPQLLMSSSGGKTYNIVVDVSRDYLTSLPQDEMTFKSQKKTFQTVQYDVTQMTRITYLSGKDFIYTSCNPIYGETSNPHRYGFAPGGSSSGEGALVADGASPLGFGTDTGGSIRVPSHMCGICGLKPTMNRISKLGLPGTDDNHSLINAALGPMAKNVSTLATAMEALLCPLMFHLDPYVPPIPFNDKVFNSTKKLRIGFYVDDGYNKPIPAVSRAVKLAKKALEDAGHTLVPFQVPRIEEVMKIITASIFADGGKLLLERIRGNLEEPRLGGVFGKVRWPSMIRNIVTFFLSFKWPRVAHDFYLHGGGDRSVARMWNLEVEASDYKKEFFSAWTDAGLDTIICPPYPIASGPYKHLENLTALMSYTILYNFLDYPAGIVPVTKVSQSDTDELRNWKGHYGDPWDANIQEACKDSVGMPVGVQCVARPWHDEMCLRVMKELESSIARG